MSETEKKIWYELFSKWIVRKNMLTDLIQKVTDQYSCKEQDIKIGPLFESSVFIEMGPKCGNCENSIKCKNDLIDKITETFTWITQVKIY